MLDFAVGKGYHECIMGSISPGEFQPVGPILGSGVYALVFYGEVVYVGQARRMLHRVYAHRNLYDRKRKGGKLPASGPMSGIKAIRFTDIWVLPCKEADLDRVEKQMIVRYRPKHNIRDKPEGQISLAEAGLDLATLVAKIGRPRIAEPDFVRRL